MRTRIESLGVYLPEQERSTRSILEQCREKVLLPFELITGIRSRRAVSADEFAIDLAGRAIEQCLAASAYEAEDIDLLIACNISRYDAPTAFSVQPSTAVKLKRRYGFRKAITFDVTAACAGVFAAMVIVDAFLQNKLIRRALIVSGEFLTHLIDTAQLELTGPSDPRLACLTLGDAGAALTLDAEGGNEKALHRLELFTLGSFSSLCVGRRSEREHGGAIMLTDARAIVRTGIEHGVQHAVETLQNEGWVQRPFDHFIMHQVSERALRTAARLIDDQLPSTRAHKKAIINVRDRGNTASTSYLVALWDAVREGTVNSGDRVLFAASGSGQMVGTALYELDDLPERIRNGAKGPRRQIERTTDVAAEPACHRFGHPARIESIGLAPGPFAEEAGVAAMGTMAARDCLRRSGHEKSDIDVLLFVGTHRDQFIAEPPVAAMIAGDMGINATPAEARHRKTLAFDILNGGLGFLNGCHVASAIIDRDPTKTVMVVAAEADTRSPEERPLTPGIAVVASAAILEASVDGTGFQAFMFRDFVQHGNLFRSYADLRAGAGWLVEERSPELDHVYSECIMETIRCLAASGDLEFGEVAVVCPPQMSPGFVESLSDRMASQGAKHVVHLGMGADVFASSVPFALRAAGEITNQARGSTGLLIGVAAGVQVCCATYAL